MMSSGWTMIAFVLDKTVSNQAKWQPSSTNDTKVRTGAL